MERVTLKIWIEGEGTCWGWTGMAAPSDSMQKLTAMAMIDTTNMPGPLRVLRGRKIKSVFVLARHDYLGWDPENSH